MIVADPGVSLFERGRVEGWLPYQQGVQYATQRPNIRLVAVRLLVQHFRSDVVRRAAYRPAYIQIDYMLRRFVDAASCVCLDERIHQISTIVSGRRKRDLRCPYVFVEEDDS